MPRDEGTKGDWRRALVGGLRVMRAPAKPISNTLERRFETRYLGKYRFAIALFYIDLALLALALGLVSVSASYLAAPVRLGNLEPLEISFASDPQEPRAGDSVRIAVRVTNRSASAVSEASLLVRLPSGFYSLPGEIPAGRIEIGDMAPGASAEVGYRAIATLPSWPSDDKAFAVASGKWRGKDVGYEAERAISVSGQALSLGFALPETLTPNGRIEVPIAISSDATVPLGPLELVACSAGALSIESGGERCSVVDLGEMAPASVATSSVALVVGDGTESDGAFSVSVVFRNSNVGPIAERKELVPVSAKALSLSRPEGVSAVSDGDDTGVTVIVNGVVGSDRRPFGIVLEDGDDETLIYSSDDLAETKIAERGTVFLSVPLGSAYRPGATLVAVESPYSGRGSERLSAPLVLPDPFVPGFSANARYRTADGEQLGRGPVPPAVGETTEYWVFWNLSETDRQLASIEASAILPEGVTWLGKIGGATENGMEPHYDPDFRLVRWTASDIGSVSGDGLGVAFAVSLTPSEADIGRVLPLLGPTEYIMMTDDGVRTVGALSVVTAADTGEPGTVVAGE